MLLHDNGDYWVYMGYMYLKCFPLPIPPGCCSECRKFLVSVILLERLWLPSRTCPIFILIGTDDIMNMRWLISKHLKLWYLPYTCIKPGCRYKGYIEYNRSCTYLIYTKTVIQFRIEFMRLMLFPTLPCVAETTGSRSRCPDLRNNFLSVAALQWQRFQV